MPPSATHTGTSIGIADYDRLVSLLGQEFDGTAQRGSTLPILYDEFGVESDIPAAKLGLYTGAEAATVHPSTRRRRPRTTTRRCSSSSVSRT